MANWSNSYGDNELFPQLIVIFFFCKPCSYTSVTILLHVFEYSIGSIKILLFTLIDNLKIYIQNKKVKILIMKMVKDKFYSMKNQHSA